MRAPERHAWLLALAAALWPWLWVVPALAYCRTTTCQDCPRDEDGCSMGGAPLYWRGGCVSLALQADASDMVDYETVQALTEQAFLTWNSVICQPSGLPPSIELRDAGGPVLCGRSEFVGGAANANILVFRDEVWPYSAAGNELASTIVRSRADGELVDADIEINALRPLLVAGQPQGTITGAHDLLSILTHELGHFLGIDHSMEPDSIMQLQLPPRLIRTTLGDDDVAAICDAYPPERDTPPCDPTPYGAFSPQCALDPATGGACSASPAPGNGRGLPSWLAAVVLVGLAMRRYPLSGSRRPCFHSRR